MGKIIYEVGENLYINLTSRCSNACVFCVRNGKDSYFGNELWLKQEPSAEEVIRQLESTNLNKYGEFVFCGFGEPTYKIDEIEQISKYLKSKGLKTRLNTNGHANIIHKKDVTEKLKDVDVINVSLNAADAASYQKVCVSRYGEQAFYEMLDFAVKCKEKGLNVLLSVVDSIGKDEIEKCRALADNYGLKLKVRELIQDS